MIVKDGDRAIATGSTSLYASPWGAKPEEVGKTYLSSIEEKGDTISIRWNAPMVPSPTAGVYGYTYKATGDYHGDKPPVPIPARRVVDIKRCSVSAASWTLLPLSTDWNFLIELKARNNAADPNSIALEIAFYPHASQSMRRFVKAQGKALGWFGDYFATLLPGPSGKYPLAAFVPIADVAAPQIDFAGAFPFLQSKKLLTGDEWITGAAAGVEPVTGAGLLQVKGLALDIG